jgi:hypothetical protein
MKMRQLLWQPLQRNSKIFVEKGLIKGGLLDPPFFILAPNFRYHISKEILYFQISAYYSCHLNSLLII